jgi:hypothetical protein
MIGDFVPPASPAAIDWALAYGCAGMRVFPCGADKGPIGKLCPHGVKDATTDAAVIRRWWTRAPFADPGWAVPRELLVVDLDEKNGKHCIRDFIPQGGVNPADVITPQTTTPSGGRHLIFRADGATYRNVTGLNGWGIDLKTAGGYVVSPAPGNGCVWIKPLTTLLAPAPDWIPKADDRPQEPHGEAMPFCGEVSRYARGALESEFATVAGAPHGARNPTLNTAAFNLGTLIGSGDLPRDLVEARLYEAAIANGLVAEDGERSVRATIRSGLESGLKKPRARSSDAPEILAAWLAETKAASERKPWRWRASA